MSEKKKIFIGQTVLNIILFIIAFTMFFPFIYLLLVSFTDPSAYHAGELNFWPEKWSLAAYDYILSGGGFVNAFKSTVIITVIGTPLNVLFNSGLAYLLAKKGAPGRGILMKLVIFTMLFSAGMIPGYLNILRLGLYNSWWASILPATCGAWNLMVMKSFFMAFRIRWKKRRLSTAATKFRFSSALCFLCLRRCWRPLPFLLRFPTGIHTSAP